jgi:small subunit ribosomal protein S5
VKVNLEELTLKDKVVQISRVAKVVKGGKRFSFGALVVVGDGQGWVGYGKGKASEVPDAIRKGVEKAKKNLIKIPLKNGTIPYEVMGYYGAEEIVIKPAGKGTGIIAGGAVRVVMGVAGIQNVICKALGSGNPANMVKATLNGLLKLQSPDEVMKLRQIKRIEGLESGKTTVG